MAERRLVAICGGSAGVGRATAHVFARAGYAVAILARGERGLAETEAELRGYGVPLTTLSVDVADADALRAASERLEHELGTPDVWVNAAMVTLFSPVRQLTAEEIRRVTEVTYLGTVHGTLAALERMRPRDHGVIIQVGSALAYRAIPLQAAYCAAKFAVRGFTDALRCELLEEGSGIRLCMVQLPALDTPQFDWARNRLPRKPQPVPPIHHPNLAAHAIYAAVDKTPRELWLGASTLQAILANGVAPGLLDRLLARRAYVGQMSEQAEPGGRPDNLFLPLEEGHATCGRFASRSRCSALLLSAATVSWGLLGAALLLAALLLWL
ncbi:SDR family oxidoreductase [Pseudomonas paraeruginosa]|uniref:SDR family oxidoreductase n=1 Tax=Pseudomonas paraeruginosa TaxID=2994495 RepID=UPI0034D74AAB|nr:SDR family NAD(P)-dependent oxidoreductase [Pseudomonas aeruginosa]HCF2412335.1 SDR family oxidoreductase [Pseudomonas aeruginosa]